MKGYKTPISLEVGEEVAAPIDLTNTKLKINSNIDIYIL